MLSCVRWRDRLVEVVTRANFLLLRWGKEKLSPDMCKAVAWEETSTEQGLLMQERLNLAHGKTIRRTAHQTSAVHKEDSETSTK